MKKIIKSLCLSMFLCIICTMPVLALSLDQNVKLLKGTTEQVIVKPQPRGSIISTGTLRISNGQDGTIGVFMQTLAHVDVDETSFGVYLDRWIVKRDGQILNIIHFHLLKRSIQMKIWQ